MKAAHIDVTLPGNMLLDIWKKFVLLSGHVAHEAIMDETALQDMLCAALPSSTVPLRHPGLFAKDRHEAIDAVNAILQGHHPGVGPSSGQVCSPAVSLSHSFTANNTRSTGPTCAASSVTLTFFEMEIAERALDLEAFLADVIAMGAAGDENHIMAGCRHSLAEISADRPCAITAIRI
jgi:hypothetical protein